MDISLEELRWASNEVERQGGKASEVVNMIQAWKYACNAQKSPKFGQGEFLPFKIETLGSIVCPEANRSGFRDVDLIFPPDAQNHKKVARSIASLRKNGQGLTPLEWIEEFLRIHPFNDGNGRTAAIIYNILIENMDNPAPLPEINFSIRQGNIHA